MTIPSYVKKYFWDADIAKTDLKKRAPYVIERILEYGDDRAFKWLKQNVRRELIKKTLISTRALSPQSANFWALVFGVPKNKVLCLKKQFLARRLKHWIW